MPITNPKFYHKNKLKVASLLAGAFILLASISGCKKETLNNALPVEKMQAVQIIDEETAQVTGTIISAGGDAIQYEGFCYGTDSMPDILENQTFENASKTDFSTKIQVSEDHTYYVRCFAANGFGYSISSPIKFKVPHAQPAVAPCSLSSNTIDDGTGRWKIDEVLSGTPYATAGTWGLEADYAQSSALRMNFNKVPSNGIFITNGDEGQFSDDQSPKEVYVELDNFNRYTMQSGDTVYVAENPDKSLSISFCNLHYHVNSFKATVSGKFNAH